MADTSVPTGIGPSTDEERVAIALELHKATFEYATPPTVNAVVNVGKLGGAWSGDIVRTKGKLIRQYDGTFGVVSIDAVNVPQSACDRSGWPSFVQYSDNDRLSGRSLIFPAERETRPVMMEDPVVEWHESHRQNDVAPISEIALAEILQLTGLRIEPVAFRFPVMLKGNSTSGHFVFWYLSANLLVLRLAVDLSDQLRAGQLALFTESGTATRTYHYQLPPTGEDEQTFIRQFGVSRPEWLVVQPLIALPLTESLPTDLPEGAQAKGKCRYCGDWTYFVFSAKAGLPAHCSAAITDIQKVG